MYTSIDHYEIRLNNSMLVVIYFEFGEYGVLEGIFPMYYCRAIFYRWNKHKNKYLHSLTIHILL